MGNGSKILFWKDTWKGDTSFAVLFPRLFRLTSYPMTTIVEVRNIDSNWDFGFRRELNDREREELSSLLQIIQTVNLTSYPDNRIWVSDPLGFFFKTFFCFSD